MVHSLSQSYRREAITKILGAAEMAEVAKTRKYKASVDADRAEFFPFIVESFGGLGAKAQEIIKILACLLYTSPSPRD